MELTHVCLRGNQAEQRRLAGTMKAQFPELTKEPLESISYKAILRETRQMFCHIGVNRQNRALQLFMSCNLKYLDTKTFSDVPVEHKEKFNTFVEAASSGKLSQDDCSMIVSWQEASNKT